MELPDLVAARKDIEGFSGWSEPEPDTGGMWFIAPLSVAGVIQEAFTLHGLALRDIPDRNVVFELKVAGPKGRKVSIARFEWRSAREGHTNSRRKGSPVSGTRVSATHYHSFELNWLSSAHRMRSGNLPQAASFEPEPDSFEALTVEVGKLFRINNMHVVPPPKWEYDMFRHG